MPPIKSFASSDRFLAEISTPNLKPGYVLAGDEAFLYQRCRAGILAALAPPDQRDFCLHDLDLGDTPIFDVLDRAQTPSLMVPFQVLFVRNLKTLYGRGSKKEEFAAIDAYFRRANPQAVIIFVADHLHIPTDLQRRGDPSVGPAGAGRSARTRRRARRRHDADRQRVRKAGTLRAGQDAAAPTGRSLRHA